MDLTEVKRAIAVLYREAEGPHHAAANEYLMGLVPTTEAWSILPPLLSSDNFHERFFAMNTLKQKVQQHWSQIEGPEQEEMFNLVVQTVQDLLVQTTRERSNPQLALLLQQAVLALGHAVVKAMHIGQAEFPASLLDVGVALADGDHTAVLHSRLQVLHGCVEAVGNAPMQVQHRIMPRVLVLQDTVLETIMTVMQMDAAQAPHVYQLQSLALDVLAGWVHVASHLTLDHDLVRQTLAPLCFRCLRDMGLFTKAAQVLQVMVRRPMAEEMLAPLVQEMLAGVEGVYQSGLEEEDADLCSEVSELIADFCQSHIDDLMEHASEDTQRLIQFVLVITDHPQHEVSISTFETWSKLAHHLEEYASVGNTPAFALYRDLFLQLVNTIIRHMAYPEGFVSWATDMSYDEEEFQRYRRQARDVLIDAYEVLGRSFVEALANSLDQADLEWRWQESLFYALAISAEAILPEMYAEDILIQIFNNVTPFAQRHTLVSVAILGLIKEYVPWLSTAGAVDVMTLLGFLLRSTGNSNKNQSNNVQQQQRDAMKEASMSLVELACGCSRRIYPALTQDMVATWKSCADYQADAPQIRANILAALARVYIVAEPAHEQFQLLLHDLFSPLATIAQEIAAQESQQQQQLTPQQRQHAVRRLATVLLMCDHVVKTLARFDNENIPDDSPRAARWVAVGMLTHWPLLKQVAGPLLSVDENLVDTFCELLARIMTLCDDHLNTDTLSDMVSLLAEAYQADAREHYLRVFTKFFVTYAHEFAKDPNGAAALRDLLGNICARTFAVLNADSQRSDLLRSVFVFLSGVVAQAPAVFFAVDETVLASAFDWFFRCADTGIPSFYRPVLKFLNSMVKVHDEQAMHMLTAVLAREGGKIIASCLGLIYAGKSSATEYVVDIMIPLLQRHDANAGGVLGQQVEGFLLTRHPECMSAAQAQSVVELFRGYTQRLNPNITPDPVRRMFKAFIKGLADVAGGLRDPQELLGDHHATLLNLSKA